MEDEDQVVSLPPAVYNSQPRIKRQAGTDAGVQFCYSIGKLTVKNLPIRIKTNYFFCVAFIFWFTLFLISK